MATCIQTNPLKTPPEELAQELRDAGVSVQPHPWLVNCFEITGTGDLERLPAFAEGRCTVQDAAARLAAMAAAPAPGDRVLDVCPHRAASPSLWRWRWATGETSCPAISTPQAEAHRKRRGAAGHYHRAHGAGRWAERHAAWVEQADVVLADVPCSGLGIIRKKPDIRWKDPAALAALPAIQRAILGNAAAYVRPGGVLVYSTCTVLPEENGGVVTDFLSGHPEFVKEDFDLPGIGSCSGDATLWPQRTRTDGFYICRMRRRA